MFYLILFIYNLISAIFIGYLFTHCTPKNAVTLVICFVSGICWLPLFFVSLFCKGE